MGKCCVFVGSFCADDGGDTITVYGWATIKDGVQTVKYFDVDGNEYDYADLIPMSCPPANPFNVTFEFGTDADCISDSVTVTIIITLSDAGGIVDDSVFELHFSVSGVALISGDPNIVVDDINVTEFRVVDAGALTNPITLTARIPNTDCDPISVVADVVSITPLLHGWVIDTSTPDTLNYP